MNMNHYPLLADLFDYPTEGYGERVAAVSRMLGERFPDAQALVEEFRGLLPQGDLVAWQELHTRSFDVQAITTLDLGYVLFGEDYKRGELLANLAREHRLAGTDLRGELPDHLSNLLRLLPHLEGELRAELVREIIAPALRRMAREFDPDRLQKKDDFYHKSHKTLIEAPVAERTAYRLAIAALLELLTWDFGVEPAIVDERADSFLNSLQAEAAIEEDAPQEVATKTRH